MEDEEEDEGEVEPAPGQVTMLRGRSAREGGREGGREEEGHTTTIFASYSDERLLQLLEQRLARGEEGKNEQDNV